MLIGRSFLPGEGREGEPRIPESALELAGLGRARAIAIVRHRSDHGPIKDTDELAAVLSDYPLTEAQRERADISPADLTAPEAPGA